MPSAPLLPASEMKAAGAPPANPLNFLLAAAEAHSKGEFQSAPVLTSKPLGSGKGRNSKAKLEVVK